MIPSSRGRRPADGGPVTCSSAPAAPDDRRPGQEKIPGAHMLDVSLSIASATPSIEIHPLGICNRDDQVRLVFHAQPGPGVVLGIADVGERFRLVGNEVEAAEPDAPRPNLPVARAIWKP